MCRFQPSHAYDCMGGDAGFMNMSTSVGLAVEMPLDSLINVGLLLNVPDTI